MKILRMKMVNEDYIYLPFQDIPMNCYWLYTKVYQPQGKKMILSEHERTINLWNVLYVDVVNVKTTSRESE